MVRAEHYGDCTYFASLSNGRPTDGICTCGFGSQVLYDSGGRNDSKLYSKERKKDMMTKSDTFSEFLDSVSKDISLYDWYVGQAVSGLLSNHKGFYDNKVIAKKAHDMAEELVRLKHEECLQQQKEINKND